MVEIKKDSVDYRDPTPFDDGTLQSISAISIALRHKLFGVDVREAIAQQGEALVKLMSDTGTSPNAEVVAARGDYGTLGMREDAQDNFLVLSDDKAQSAIDVANEAMSRAQSVANGSPAGVFDTVADLQAKYPSGDKHIYVVKADNNWYYWDGSSWKSGGQYLAGSVEDFTKNVTRQKLNQFNKDLNKGKRVSGVKDDGTVNITDANDSAYVSFSSAGISESILRVPIYTSFILGQFITICDKDDKVVYNFGYKAIVDQLNSGKNTNFFSFVNNGLVDISIKQLLSAVDGTPVKILLGFPIEADKDHLNLYLKNSIRSENYMPWIKTDIPTLCYETDYGTAPKSRDSQGRIVYGTSTDQLVKKFDTSNYPSGDLIISTPTEMPKSDGTYNTGVFIDRKSVV